MKFILNFREVFLPAERITFRGVSGPTPNSSQIESETETHDET